MEVNGIDSYLQTQYANASSSNAAEKAKGSANGISSTSSREEIEEAVKSFEGYFVEQVIKQMKKSVESINEDEDSTVSMYSDYFMDSTISQLASDLVDQLGGSLTKDFTDQIMRNYGITDPVEEVEDLEDLEAMETLADLEEAEALEEVDEVELAEENGLVESVEEA